MKDQQSTSPSVSHAEPVLVVADIMQTVNYYHESLGFPDTWTYGEPINHGGASWHGAAFIQFSLDKIFAVQPHHESVWLRVKQLEILHSLHQRNGVEIIQPLVKRPWGFVEYTVRDINGFLITFAEPFTEKKIRAFSSNISIRQGFPTAHQLTQLCYAVGWQPSTNSAMATQLSNSLIGFVADDDETGEIIACSFLLGDHKTFYYVKDVIVHPDWQGRGIGTAMMKALMHWLDNNGAESATVGLFTGDHLAPFYRQFGFTQACGMYKQVKRSLQK